MPLLISKLGSRRSVFTTMGMVVVLVSGGASADVVAVSGDGSASSPYVLSGSGDITSYVVNNSYIQLGGGTYTIDIPTSGTGVTTAGNGTTIVAGDGNIASTTPVITYSGVISGTGQVIVTNATSTVQPSLYNKLNGGALLVTNAQTFTNPNGSTFVVDANTLLSINGGSIPAGSALTNNGEIYANKDGYTFTKIDGAGNIVLENDDLNEAHVSGINTISGNSLLLYGEYINAGTVLPESLSIISDDIDVIKNGGSATNSFFYNYNQSHNTIIGGNYYSDGPDTQLQGGGVTQFNGQSFIIVRNSAVKGVTGIYPASEAEKYDYFYNISDKKGRVFYIVQGTMLMGDGRAIVNHDDCLNVVGACFNSNNTFAQGNPYQQNFVIETGQFDYTPITTLAQAQALQTVALDYSGTYTFNVNVNFQAGNVDATATGGVNVTDGSGNLGPTKGDASSTIVGGEDYGNFVLVNPGDGKAPNHVIVTEPIYEQGITQVQRNTILQLGDGTAGTPYGTKGTATTNGVTGTYDFSSSGGNGMVVTAGNAAPIFQNAAFYQIQDDGEIIVDNVPNARDLVNASTAANAFMAANELDNIVGVGGLEQMGSLALTLGGNTTYSGETDVDAHSTLYLKTIAGTGTTGLPNSVLNLRGTLATFDISQADASNTLAGLTGVAGSVLALGNRNLTVHSTVASTFSGVIQDGGLGGGVGGSLTKTGAAMLTLDGTNTYTGLTDVREGALAVGDSNNADAAIGGSAQVESGATLLGHGTIAGSLMNLGTVQPGGSIGTLTVGGNYTQASGATLQIDVTPSASSVLSVAGTATLAGTATFNFAPGTYTDRTYTYLTAGGGIVGRFATITYQGSVPVGAEAPSATYSATGAQLVVGNGTPSSTSSSTSTSSTSSATTTSTSSTSTATSSATATSTVALVVRPGDEQLPSEQNAQLAIVTDRATETLLGRPASGSAGTPTACGPSPTDAGRAVASLGMREGAQAVTALGTALCPLGGWVQGSGTLTSVAGDATVSGFHGGTAGFLGGIDRTLGPYGTLLGIAVGDDQSSLTDEAGGSAATNTVRAGVYGSQPLGRMIVSAALMAGYDTASTKRETTAGKAYENHHGSVINGGVQASLPMEVGGFALAPAVGVRVARVDQGAFAESPSTAASGFAVSGAPVRLDSVLPYARLGIAKVIALANGAILTPTLQVGYAYQAGTYTQAVSLSAQDGTLFESRAANLGRGDPAVAAGLTYRTRDLALFVTYAANVGDNWRSQTFIGGLRGLF